MTSINIPANDRRIEYTGNINTIYTYDFPIAANTAITVSKNGVDLVLTTDYTVQDVGVQAGGTITLVVATTVNDDLILFGSAIVKRVDQNFQQAGDFFSITLNGQLNAQVVFIQELTTKIDRKFGLSDNSTYAGSKDFPDAAAGQLLGWNSTEDALENKDPDSLGQLPSVPDTYVRRGTISYEAKTPLEVATELFALKTTDNLTQGSTNKYLTGNEFQKGTDNSDDVTQGSTNLYDKTVVLNDGTGITVTGTYPNFTITNTGTSELPIDYISGGVISNNSGTPDEIIDITDSIARSSDDTEDLSVSAGSLNITTAGDNANGVAYALELQPLMTNNTTGQRTPNGICTGSTSPTPNNDFYVGFDGDKTIASIIWGSTPTAFLNFDFETTVRIKGIRFYNNTSGSIQRSKDVNVYKDGDTGDILASFTAVNSDFGESIVLFDNVVETSQIGVDIQSSYGVNVGVGEIEFIFDDGVFVWNEWNGGANQFILDNCGGNNLDNTGKSRRIGFIGIDSSVDIIAGSQVQDIPEPYKIVIDGKEDILFEGSAGVSTIGLSEDINNFNQLEFTCFSSNNGTTIILSITVDSWKTITSSSNELVLNLSTSSTNRFIEIYYESDTTIRIENTISAVLTKVVGIK